MRFSDYLTEAPKVHPNDRVQLVIDLLRETNSNYRMKLTAVHPDAAFDEAVQIMSRVVRQGLLVSDIIESINKLAGVVNAVRKATTPIPANTKELAYHGIWLDNQETGRVLASLEAQQNNTDTAAIFLHDLGEILSALQGLYQLFDGGIGHDGRIGANDGERSFLRAGFKKLGIIK